MVYSSTDTRSPRVSTTAYTIRKNALDLLERSTPEHEIVFSYGTEDEESDWNPLEPISYQHCPEIADMQRELYGNGMAASSHHQWVDALLPAMSCISSACRVGISEIAKHTSDGFHMVQNEVRNRRAVPYPQTLRGSYEAVKVSGYQQSKARRKQYIAIPDQTRQQHVLATGQETSEVQTAKGCKGEDAGQQGDFHRLDPADWEPLGFLFVPAEEARKLRFSDEDYLSEATDDGGNWSENICPRLCPIE